MKKLILGLILLVVLAGCIDDATITNTTGVEKFSETGLTATSSGLSFEGVSVHSSDGLLLSNEMEIGDKLTIFFKEVIGLTEQGGNTFPGASMTVIDSKGKMVLPGDDVFAEFNQTGVPKEDTEDIFLTFIIGSPMVVGETYSVSGRIWDKKGEGEIKFEVDIVTTWPSGSGDVGNGTSDTDSELIGKWKYVKDSATSYLEFMEGGRAAMTLPGESETPCTYFIEEDNLTVNCPIMNNPVEEYVYSISNDVLKLTTTYSQDLFFSRVN